MSACPDIGFLPLAPAHLELLHGWLQQPHVRAFWDDGDRTLEQVRAHYFAPGEDAVAFVCTLGGRMAGYLQTYPVDQGSAYAGWRSGTGETWGLDLLLGEEGDTGRGHGPAVITAFLAFWRAERPDLRRVLIDPDVRNRRAVLAYRKAGFRMLGAPAASAGPLQILGLDLLP